MKEFIYILFLSKIILLTPVPVNLNSSWMEITPKTPLKAITAGASLQVDISKIAGGVNDFQILHKKFPASSIEARLITKSGKEFLLYNSSFSYSGNEVRIILTGTSPISTHDEFVKILVRSNKLIEGAKIYWKNYQQ